MPIGAPIDKLCYNTNGEAFDYSIPLLNIAPPRGHHFNADVYSIGAFFTFLSSHSQFPSNQSPSKHVQLYSLTNPIHLQEFSADFESPASFDNDPAPTYPLIASTHQTFSAAR
jgi:hypothetical protein